MPAADPRVALVAPWPPPEGGMSVQARGLSEALRSAGTEVRVVPTNVGLGLLGRIKGVRGVVNLAIYLVRLVCTVPRVDVVHVLAASGLLLLPVHGARGRGGPAPATSRDRQLPRRPGRRLPRGARQLGAAVPAPREGVFTKHGYASEIISNYVDVDRFDVTANPASAPVILVTRNLERIYNVGAAIEAIALIREQHADAELWIAGTGSERASLDARATDLGVFDAVRFLGRVPNEDIPALYAGAAIALNPTNVDNMPISVLEAFASGVPVVSTRAGGVPFIVEDGVSGLLTDVGDARGLADACVRILESSDLADALRAEGRSAVERFGISAVVGAWRACYRETASSAD